MKKLIPLAAAALLLATPAADLPPGTLALCGMVAGAAAGSIPVGGVATGDGSAREPGVTAGIAYGGLALLTAMAALIVARRRAFTLPRAPR
ncbi:hypothetical protein [Actinoplanes sp. NPDC023714]|uniref:hypothetical protein n=1 Tax=Actinoplanes sp. NPDC023714 TaxID=3154322 RepID=UPI0033F8BBD6